jgi:hypothetical protein
MMDCSARSGRAGVARSSGIVQGVGESQGLGEGEGAHDHEVQRLLGAIVEAHVDQGFVPWMEIAQLVHRGARGHLEDARHLAIAGDLDLLGFGGKRADFRPLLRLDHVGVLVDEGRIEQEARVLEGELVLGFEDAALSQQDGLAPGEQFADRQVPLFEGDVQAVHGG